MTKGSEKRRDPRVPLVLRVDYPGENTKVRDVTENLSAGGLFIRTERTLAPGDRVPLQISFPSLLDPVEIEVEVVRGRPAGEAGPAGLAVRVPIDRIDDRHKLASLAEIGRTGLAAGRAKRSFRVLVVEDNPHVIEMYEYALRKLRAPDGSIEMGIEYGSNGHEALLRLRRPPRIDLVMADLYMPVMDGFSLLEKMKADPALLEIPTVVISAGGPDARARAESLGVDVYLQKPVQFMDVIATVRTLLKLKT
jgi:uncharacterized protein (TIGR02266 family)